METHEICGIGSVGGGGGPLKKYACPHEKCGYTTNKLFNFQRHRKIHEKKAALREMAANANIHGILDSQARIQSSPASVKLQRPDIECAHHDCMYSSDQLEDYVEHVHSAHDSSLKFIDQRFADRDALEHFLTRLQEQSACSMVVSRSLDGEPPESFELCCSQSGRFRRLPNGELRLNSADSLGEPRSGVYCTFYLSVNVYDNAIYVKGCESHFGHNLPDGISHIPAAAAVAQFHQLNQLNAVAAAAAAAVAASTASASPPNSTFGKFDATSMEDFAPEPKHDDSQNIRPAEADVIVDVDERIAVDQKSPNYQSELRRIALDIQTEAELFMESEAALSELEYHELEKASSTMLNILRTCRTRPVLSTLRSSNDQTPPATQVPTSLADNPLALAALDPRLAQLQRLQQLQQQLAHQQLLIQQRNALAAAGAQMPLPQIQNAALLLSAAAAAHNSSTPHPMIAALANSMGQQSPLAAAASSVASGTPSPTQLQRIAQTTNNNNGSCAASPPASVAATVPPSAAALLQQLQLLNNVQNQVVSSSQAAGKFDDLVRKAVLELERRAVCAACCRNDAPAYANLTGANGWFECRGCQLRFHAGCAPSGQCLKCKASFR